MNMNVKTAQVFTVSKSTQLYATHKHVADTFL